MAVVRSFGNYDLAIGLPDLDDRDLKSYARPSRHRV
jgi:hypothetical protein